MLFVWLMQDGSFGLHMYAYPGFLQMITCQWGVFRLGVDGSQTGKVVQKSLDAVAD
ncbi:hypothetical protein GGR54DRAFT_586989 [Hypoxylon sp. NC1633]|nr:hypothetical protein GGR54DRAFT_586989 [Hypoxylon sp. NC1633]